MPDESDPPRKFYQLKPKEFENVNQVPPPPAADAAAPDPATQPPVRDGGRIDVKDLFRHAQTGGRLLSPKVKPAGTQNEVHAMLRDNLERANAAGLNDLAPMPKRISRRKRHYWLMMVSGSAVFATMTLVSGPKSPLLFVCGIAGLVMFNLGLWWVMWHIMEDY